jgi:signal peptidase II
VNASRQWLGRQLGPRGGRLGLVAAVCAGVVLLDAATKIAATQFLAGEGKVEILGGLISLQFYRNFAGPNDILPGHTVLISLFAILATVVLIVVATRVTSTAGALAVGLLLGGAIGNLLDRLFREPAPLRGGVIDWLQLTSRSKSMNVADLAIDAAIAVVLVAWLLSWWRGRQSDEDKPQRRPSTAGD